MYRALNLMMFIGFIALSMMMSSQPSAKPQQMKVEPGVSLELAEYRKQNISDIHYSLDFTLPKGIEASIDANAKISFKLASLEHDLQLDFKEAAENLLSLSVNDSDTPINHQNEHLVIPRSALKKGSNELSIKFVAGNSSLNRNPDFLYTLFVPDRARTAFPVFDQPNLKATYDSSG